jgi:peptidoglycan/LPS O-acetylase OafA/YrhL
MKYIKGYDGLRAISIILVLITHLGWLEGTIHDDVANGRIQLLFSGVTGVRIFFVLSGFLITRILMQEKIATGRISFKRFYTRRFLRLLPPLVLFFAAMTLLMAFGYLPGSWIGLIFSALYLYNFVPNKYYSGELGHTWSLGVEEQFYFFWPFVIAFLRKYITWFVFLVILLCILGAIYLPIMSISYHGKRYPLTDLSRVDRWFIPAAAPIMVGAWFSYAVINNEAKLRAYFSGKFLFLVLAVLLFFSPAYAPPVLFTSLPLVQMLGISLLLLWIFYNQDSLLTKCLEWGPVSYIGKISYGIYVYHGLFLRTSPGGSLFIQQYPVNIILTFGTAILSYEFYEKRFLRLKKRFA